MVQTIEELTMTWLSLVFLLLGVVLIASITYSMFNPYEQIAVANTRKLAAVMNQACVSEGSPISIDFNLAQNVPFGSNFLDVLPSWLMRLNGDPNFIVYYESFSPGEAIGWETYQHFDHRLYIILPASLENHGLAVQGGVVDYVAGRVRDFQSRNPGVVLEGVVIGNLILNDRYAGINATKLISNANAPQEIIGGRADIASGTPQSGSSTQSSFFAFGSWDSSRAGTPLNSFRQEDFFRFKNYQGLASVEKSLVKYESCGPYSLCLKTRSGVYRFPLANCAEKIKTVQMVYDARNDKRLTAVTATFGIAAAKKGGVMAALSKIPLVGVIARFGSIPVILSSIGSAIFSVKTSDLSLTSPCHIPEAEVVMSSCQDHDLCTHYISYPLFSVQDDILHEQSRHVICADKIETKPDRTLLADVPSIPSRSFSVEPNDGGKCIQMKVFHSVEGFCWTPDPSSNTFGFWDQYTRTLADTIGYTPVRDAAEFLPTSGDIALRPTGNDDLKRFYSIWETYWGWPGIGSKS